MTLGVDAVHELLKSKHGNVSAREPLTSLRGHLTRAKSHQITAEISTHTTTTGIELRKFIHPMN
jgi:hypothetical protein